jgi:hypothetical protein
MSDFIKYNMGDSIYYIKNGKIQKSKITGVAVRGGVVEYLIENRMKELVELPQEYLHPSIPELVNYLYYVYALENDIKEDEYVHNNL